MSILNEVVGEILLDSLKQMKVDESLYIPVEPELMSRVELVGMKQLSIENLFHSCMGKGQDEFKKEQLDNVINEYTLATTEFLRLLHDALYQALGDEAYRYVTFPGHKMDFVPNYTTRMIVVFRAKKSACNCH